MANGEGYVRSRSKGSHTITIYLGKDENGKLRQHVETFRGSEKDAKAHMNRLIAERDKGVDLKPQQATFEELVQRWRESHYPNLPESTVDTYETLLTVHILPMLGKTKLRDLRPLHIEAVKSGVIKLGDSQKSALNVFRLTSAILKQAVRWQLISVNPADAVTPPKPKRYIATAPTPKQLAALLTAADETPYGPIARLAALTGARQGELLSAEWRDVNWETETLTIRGTKTRGSFRKIDLGTLGIALLKEHRKNEREKRLKLGPGATGGDDEATIFTNLIGKPMDAGGLKRTWKRIVKNAAVGHFRFHDLRHAAATYLFAAGAPLMAISAFMGHTRTSTTTDVYAHLLPGMGRETSTLLESVMVKTWSKAKEA